MALCVIGKGYVFSDSYRNLAAGGYDVEAIQSDVAKRLADAYPALMWFPETGEIGVEADNLRAAKAEYPIEDIRSLMEAAYAEAIASATPIKPVDPILDRFVGRTSVRRLRESAGMTQKQLAERVGVKVSWVQKLEYGDIRPENITLKNALALSDVLGCEPKDLLR